MYLDIIIVSCTHYVCMPVCHMLLYYCDNLDCVWHSNPLISKGFIVLQSLSLFMYKLFRGKPNCVMVAMESLILFRRNKTAKWLKSKSANEKDKLFKACIKVGR